MSHFNRYLEYVPDDAPTSGDDTPGVMPTDYGTDIGQNSGAADKGPSSSDFVADPGIDTIS